MAVDTQLVNVSCGVGTVRDFDQIGITPKRSVYSHLRAKLAPSASNWRLACSGQPRVTSRLQSVALLLVM
jgi:hypothetical protein